MACFSITTKSALSAAQELDVSAELTRMSNDIDNIGNNLSFNIREYQSIKRQLSLIAEQIRQQSSAMRNLKESLQTIVALYENAERENITSIGDRREDILVDTSGGGPYSIDSVAFDDEGSYGGDQGNMDRTYKWNPIRCWELLGYLWEYFPNMSIFKAFSYFSHLNNVGCGYVALANTIFLEYEGRPEEFERVFGYPMYKHGDLNYDRMILDIYATTDKAGINDGSDGLPEGTVDESRAQIVERFLADKSVGVQTEANADVTADNFRQITEDGGYVILGYRYGNMYDEKGNSYYIDGGHAIVVTGVTDDGRYIVSSWGEKYYVNASDIGNDDTFMVFYYDS